MDADLEEFFIRFIIAGGLFGILCGIGWFVGRESLYTQGFTLIDATNSSTLVFGGLWVFVVVCAGAAPMQSYLNKKWINWRLHRTRYRRYRFDRDRYGLFTVFTWLLTPVMCVILFGAPIAAEPERVLMAAPFGFWGLVVCMGWNGLMIALSIQRREPYTLAEETQGEDDPPSTISVDTELTVGEADVTIADVNSLLHEGDDGESVQGLTEENTHQEQKVRVPKRAEIAKQTRDK